MIKAQSEVDLADFKPSGAKAKARIKELRKVVETAVGCAFEENLFNAENGGKDNGQSRSPRATSSGGGGGRKARPRRGKTKRRQTRKR